MRKAIGIITVITAVIITVYYLTICGLRGNESALSTVGLEHHTIFTLWGISTYIALATNISITFLKTKYKFYIILLFLSAIGMALTLTCDFDYNKYPQYLAHCIGSLAFSVIMGINVFYHFSYQEIFICLDKCRYFGFGFNNAHHIQGNCIN